MKRLWPLLVVVLAAIVGALRTADKSNVPGDFLRYHRAGRLVATGRADSLYDAKFLREQRVYVAERAAGADPLREAEFKYAPALAVMMAPLGALHPRTASILWGAWTAGLIAAMFVTAWLWCGRELSGWWMLAPLVLLARPMSDNVNLGQLNPSALVPATIGLALLARGRDKAAGALIGFGTVVKYMPGVLVLWLAWQRRWKALGAFAGAIALLGFVLPAAVLGPSRSIELDREWIRVRSSVYTEAAPRDVPGYSVKSFVYRALGDTPYVTSLDSTDVHAAAPHASLPPEVLRGLVIASGLAILAAALWFTRRREDVADPLGASIWLAALLLVSPEARFPHFLYLALPLVALTCALVRGRGTAPRWGIAIAASAVGALLLNATFKTLTGGTLGGLAEFYCAPGWAALAFAIALCTLRQRRFSTQ